MLKREFKINFKSFIITTIILMSLFLLVYLMYPSIVKSNNIEMLNEMLKIFPKEILIAFNMDIFAIDSAYGWLKTEGFVFVLLVIGCYAGIIGSNILVKEENAKTIEYLNSLPIKRTNIVINKAIIGLIYILLMILIIGIFNYFCLLISGSFNHKQFFFLSMTPIFPSIVIYFLCLFLSTLTSKNKKILGMSIAIVLISYFLHMLSTISTSVEFLKYLSIFTLADMRNVIVNISLNPTIVIISILLSLVFLLLTIIKYNKKELI